MDHITTDLKATKVANSHQRRLDSHTPVVNHHRAGISLVEVMFSMAVAVIGLLGVAALVPLAANQLGRGTRADAASTFGLAVLDNVQVQHFHNPRNWLAWNSARQTLQPVNDFNAFIHGDSFCLDPNLLLRGGPSLATWPALQSFPAAAAPTDPRMLRIVVRGVPGLPDPNPNDTIEEYQITAAGEALRRAWLDRIMLQTDDLAFDRPKDATLPPEQVFSGINSPDRRQYRGRFSWFATFSPYFDVRDVSILGEFRNRGAFSDQQLYTMSVVVCDSRITDPMLAPERVAAVTTIGAGIAGGDILLRSAIEENVNVRSGDWLLLGAKVPNPAFSGQPENWPSVFRWYRVMGADREATFDSNNNVFQREVYLDGADWYLPSLGLPTQATIVSGVTAVFEKTIRLEGFTP